MAVFDLYGLFVEQVFGGLLMAIVGIVIIMAIIIMISRTSFATGIALIGFFLFICGLYYSVLTLFILTIGAISYFIFSLVRFAQGT